tara:strand:+ start:187 stop:771 length:585 start_codon:yes stop_codon:yes gene_type:complete
MTVAFLSVLFLLNFNRDPNRRIPEGKNIVSPADGKVFSILDTEDKKTIVKKRFFGKIRTLLQKNRETYLISIFMNPFNVHVQRTPLEGKVERVRYAKGLFHNAGTLLATGENEKCETVLSTKIGRVKVIQIAGFLTNRISNYLKEGYCYPKGMRMGKIHFGSQVTLIIPKKKVKSLKIKVGDRVKAGESILATY